MKTKQVELFIQARKYNWQESFEITINDHERESSQSAIFITLGKKIVNIELPTLDEKILTLAHVEQIRDQIAAEKAASYLRVTRMEDQINSLMYLENNFHNPDDILSTLDTTANE